MPNKVGTQIKSNRHREPIIVDGEEMIVAEWNPEDPRFARWCEQLMSVYEGMAKLKGLDLPDNWTAEIEGASEERATEIIGGVKKAYSDIADVVDDMEVVLDNICGEGVADVLFSYGTPENVRELIGKILGDHAKERKKSTAKYRA